MPTETPNPTSDNIQRQPQPPTIGAPELKPTPPVVRRRRWPLLLGGVLIALILFSGVSFVTATTLEEHDSFCIACHTVPEVTYYNRAYILLDHPNNTVSDLATAHYHLSQKDGKTPFACIDCHRGTGNLSDRIAAVALGARDSIIYVTGHENPAIETTQTHEGWLSNAACVSCHTDVLLNVQGLSNHFHTKLPQVADALAQGGKVTVSASFTGTAAAAQDWAKPISAAPVNCTSCHLAHSTIQNGMANFFIDSDRRNEACISCHKVAGQGPQNVANLGS